MDNTAQGNPAKAKKERKPWTRKRKIVFFSVIGFIIMLAAAGDHIRIYDSKRPDGPV